MFTRNQRGFPVGLHPLSETQISLKTGGRRVVLKPGQVMVPLEGFWEDAEAAMTNNPKYFAAWYSVKSWMLVGSLMTIAYLLGKKKGKK